jgi:hypothetical protein
MTLYNTCMEGFCKTHLTTANINAETCCVTV